MNVPVAPLFLLPRPTFRRRSSPSGSTFVRTSYTRAHGTHYDSIAVYLCLSEMGNTAGNCSLKAPFIPMGISFGSHRKRGAQLRYLSFQKRWDILEMPPKWLQKTGTIAQLSNLERTELWTYPFVLDLCDWTSDNHYRHFEDLSRSQCIFSFYFFILVRSVLRALKRDLERVVLIVVGEFGFVFSERGAAVSIYRVNYA